MINKMLLACLVTVMSFAASAQNFKKFRMGIGGGYDIPTGAGTASAALFYIEPAGRINDNWVLSLHLEIAFPPNRFSPNDRTKPSILSSYTFNGQYYINRLMSGNLHPFVGAGLGFYYIAQMDLDQGNFSRNFSSFGLAVGFYPRVGFDVGHFTFSADYNVLPLAHTDISGAKINYNYLAIHIGANIGGGSR
ncbi:MAG TPA: outer membrane beta-barrel protein [Chryseolinea sp.]